MGQPASDRSNKLGLGELTHLKSGHRPAELLVAALAELVDRPLLAEAMPAEVGVLKGRLRIANARG